MLTLASLIYKHTAMIDNTSMQSYSCTFTVSLAWPDRYFFYRAFIACSLACSISARRKKEGLVSFHYPSRS